MDTFFCPIGVQIRGVPLYNAQDTSLIWTLSSVPLVSVLERYNSPPYNYTLTPTYVPYPEGYTSTQWGY